MGKRFRRDEDKTDMPRLGPQNLPCTQRSSAGLAGICNAVLCNSQLTLLPLIMSSAHFLTPRFSRKCKQKIFSSSWNGFMSNLNLRSWRSNEERQLNVFKRFWWIYNKTKSLWRKKSTLCIGCFCCDGSLLIIHLQIIFLTQSFVIKWNKNWQNVSIQVHFILFVIMPALTSLSFSGVYQKLQNSIQDVDPL